MAPELALGSLGVLGAGSIVLDPMTGSGTVAQQAKAMGHKALGFDLDPLAVLISKVATTPVNDEELEAAGALLLAEAANLPTDSISLPWLDGDGRSEAFVKFWFGEAQRNDLRRIAYILHRADDFEISEKIADALKITLSRIIVTKKPCASLAGDTSHSRPHRMLEENDYDVFSGFERSLRSLRKRLVKIPSAGQARIGQGDARDLKSVETESIDLVLTSPPYLNAIDYMRGHKMSLIWLGYKLDELTKKRSDSIGAERKPKASRPLAQVAGIKVALGNLTDLPAKYHGMIDRYSVDLRDMLAEVARVLKHGGGATFVMGNSCLKGIYIENSAALVAAAKAVGLSKVDQWERDLPTGSRYLPTPTSGALSKRMRKEVIVSLRKL